MSLSAVYDVTRALRMLLHSQLAQASGSAVVTLLPPGDDLPAASGVNLYLYRVVESPATKNRDWPGDRLTPPAAVPALSLELSYLLTPLGTKPDDGHPELGDDAHTMLGVAMSALARYPVLNDIHLPEFDADTVLAPALQASYQRVRVTLMPTDLESLSKIWATINKPYRLSVAYEVALVELVPTDPLPGPTGPQVQHTSLAIDLFPAPVADALEPAAGPLAAVDGGGALVARTLTVHGSGLTWRTTPPAVLFGGAALPLAAAPAPSPNAVAATLPLDQAAGPQVDVQVRAGPRTSVPLPFTVTPWLARIVPLRTALDGPTVLALTGSGFGPAGAHVRLDGATTIDGGPLAAGATDTALGVTLPGTLANGVYTVRVVRDDGGATNGRPLAVIPLLSTAALTRGPPRRRRRPPARPDRRAAQRRRRAGHARRRGLRRAAQRLDRGALVHVRAQARPRPARGAGVDRRRRLARRSGSARDRAPSATGTPARTRPTSSRRSPRCGARSRRTPPARRSGARRRTTPTRRTRCPTWCAPSG